MAEETTLAVSESSVVSLSQGVRLHHDAVRGQDILLAPERAVALDEIGLSIIRQIDGKRDLGTLAKALAVEYDAPEGEILGDLLNFVADFMTLGLLAVKE